MYFVYLTTVLQNLNTLSVVHVKSPNIHPILIIDQPFECVNLNVLFDSRIITVKVNITI